MKRSLMLTTLVLALSAAPAQAGFTDECATQGKMKVCNGMVESFDGTPLDVSLTTPPKVKKGKRLPLIVFLHGFLSNKREYMSKTKKGPTDYKTVEHNNVWFASRGYAVLNYYARGHGESGGEIGLASKHFEVRDTQHLTGPARGRRDRPTASGWRPSGGSYGGGQTWLLHDHAGRGAQQFGSWRLARGQARRAGRGGAAVHLDRSAAVARAERARRFDRGARHREAARSSTASSPPRWRKLTAEMLRWIMRLNAGEPYDGDTDRSRRQSAR